VNNVKKKQRFEDSLGYTTGQWFEAIPFILEDSKLILIPKPGTIKK